MKNFLTSIESFLDSDLNLMLFQENWIKFLSLISLLLQGKIDGKKEKQIVDALHDRMTEQRYLKPIESFSLPVEPSPWIEVDILGSGKEALRRISEEMGLSFDEWDLDYYTQLFTNEIKRNPTSVECFDLAQSNSEHSRHWFFRVSNSSKSSNI